MVVAAFKYPAGFLIWLPATREEEEDREGPAQLMEVLRTTDACETEPRLGHLVFLLRAAVTENEPPSWSIQAATGAFTGIR